MQCLESPSVIQKTPNRSQGFSLWSWRKCRSVWTRKPTQVMTFSCSTVLTQSLFLALVPSYPLVCFPNFCFVLSPLLFLHPFLPYTLLCSSLSKQQVCREFWRMHLVTQMSHTSSGLRASPSGWMNERAVRLAGGGAERLKRRGLCQWPIMQLRECLVCRWWGVSFTRRCCFRPLSSPGGLWDWQGFDQI